MTKTKAQLRAEAVERLTAQLDKGNTSAHLLETVMGDVKGNGANWNAEIYALIDLLADDEIPDGDAVDIMRKAAKGGFVGGTGHVMKNAKVLLDINPVSGCDSVVFETLAGMVERDYVRRIDFEVKDAEVEDLRDERDRMRADYERIYQFQVVETERNHWKSNAERYKAERDEWKVKCETREVAYKQADAERKRYSEQIDELVAERDGLRAAYDELTAIAAQLCRVCGFSMMDASGEVVG